MDTDALQHQQELENQEMLLGFLSRIWYSQALEAKEVLTLASFLGLKREFVQHLNDKLLTDLYGQPHASL